METPKTVVKGWEQALFVCLIYLLSAFWVLAGSSSVNAQSLPSAGDTITVTATVAATRYVVVNESGRIVMIVSNTKENVLPVVYKTSLKGQHLTFTPKIALQYDHIVSGRGPNQLIGVIYSAAEKKLKKDKSPFLFVAAKFISHELLTIVS